MASQIAVDVPLALKRRTRTSVNATTALNSPMLLSLTKKLKRMPHLFDRVLELPFHADTLVEVQESRDSFSFVVKMPGLVAEEVKAEIVEIVPGATKVVIGGGQALLSDLESSEVELWRFRLPASTNPEGTVARYENEVLQVTIPKNAVSCAPAAEEEVFKRDNDTENDSSFKHGPEAEADNTRQQAADMDSSSDDTEYESTRSDGQESLDTEDSELQWQRDLFEDLESFGSPRRVREQSSCTKAAVQQQGANSPDFLRNLGSWVHGFAIFV